MAEGTVRDLAVVLRSIADGIESSFGDDDEIAREWVTDLRNVAAILEHS